MLDPAMDSPRIGVVLFSMGGPATLAEVEPFLVEVFSDRAIIELPLGAALQPLFARVLAKLRAPRVRRAYGAIGGGSPQLALTEAQAAALERRLHAGPLGDRVRVVVAMRYTRPSAADALALLAAEKIEQVVTLPLYPHWCAATTGSFEQAFRRALASWRAQGICFEVSGIDDYAEDPLYLDALAATVGDALETMAASLRREVVLLFSAHGVPKAFVDRGDPYVHRIEATRQGVVARLGWTGRHVLAYQSRTGPVRWIGPGTDELIERLAARGVRALVVVPLSFVSDHIETLYEIDLLFRRLAHACGIVEFRRAAALNSHPLFIEALARLVEAHVEAAPLVSPRPVPGGGVTR